MQRIKHACVHYACGSCMQMHAPRCSPHPLPSPWPPSMHCRSLPSPFLPLLPRSFFFFLLLLSFLTSGVEARSREKKEEAMQHAMAARCRQDDRKSVGDSRCPDARSLVVMLAPKQKAKGARCRQLGLPRRSPLRRTTPSCSTRT